MNDCLAMEGCLECMTDSQDCESLLHGLEK